MTTPEHFEQKLQQQYQHDKACHVLPQRVGREIVRRARSVKRHNGMGLWRNTQLAMSCALLLLMGYLLQPADKKEPLYYQVVVTQGEHYKEVQQHLLSPQTEYMALSQQVDPSVVYQQYTAAQQRSTAFHYHTGLLRQQEEQWQITVCDDLLLTIDRQLLSQLNLQQHKLSDFAQQQWVEFVSNSAGRLVAIKPVSSGLYCSDS
ncbi:hypothetical protein M2404_003203 [Rheinheimera pacifica]|uniref:hypothetical protein n=1 Tax=Rheinheimera pacifica TaxID=173990 RepID=UPI00216A111B|nr:hypothetical protein [Rheinheimera pacifica]MCS4308841.1 hypothetical protein [Rheinheimera pacifica]